MTEKRKGGKKRTGKKRKRWNQRRKKAFLAV